MNSLLLVCGKEIRVRGRIVRIANPELDKYESLDDPEALFNGLRNSGIRVDLFTFMQLIPGNPPKRTYPMEPDNLAVLPVTTFDHWWSHQIRSLARNRARQAEKKGVEVREMQFDDSLVEGIWAVYNESPIRQGKPNLHYGKDIESVRKMESTFLDRSIFITATLNGKMIGFAKLVTDEVRTRANLMNIMSMIKHRDKAPTNALIAQAVRSCADRGIQYLVYQNFVYGNKAPDSLTKFKEVNGFQRMDLPRYYLPLTRLGAVAYRLGLHRKFADRVPEPVAARLRELRRALRNRRLRSVTEPS